MESQVQPHVSQAVFTPVALRALILPLMLEQLLNVTMGLADTVMVSSVGEAAVSSVSLVDSFNILIIQVLGALATGGAVVASQYLGRRDPKSAGRAAAQLYSVLLSSTLVAAVVVVFLRHAILRAIFGSISEDVMRYAETYFLLTGLGYPFVGLYNAGAALFRAQGNSRVSMRASLVMNLINIAGNSLFIFVFGWGVFGAALATLIGYIVAATWLTAQQQSWSNSMRIASWQDLKPDGSLIRRILAIGIPSGLENGTFQIGKLVVSHLVSTLGTAAIAANAIAGSISGLANIPGNAICLAMIPVVGRCLGAGEKQQARGYTKKLTALAFFSLWLTELALYFCAPAAARIFNLSGEAVSTCVVICRWFALFTSLCWPLSFVLPNALRAGGDARFTMSVSMFSMWIFRVLLSYLFVLKFHMGVNGVWFGMYIDWICRSVFFCWRFAGKKWMEHKVI